MIYLRRSFILATWQSKAGHLRNGFVGIGINITKALSCYTNRILTNTYRLLIYLHLFHQRKAWGAKEHKQ